jgi:tRNA dimethylallyltransferase
MSRRVVAILGPTAVGKSWLAMELAQELGGEIVSADALQAYRGFDIGTAKPSASERAAVPHHLIDVREPHESYSAGEFARLATAAISADVRTRLRERLTREGLDVLRAELIDSDPATAERLRPGDSQRTLRALEVLESTGRTLSSWIADDPIGSNPPLSVRVGLTLPRPVLYDRIAARVRSMIQAGWVEEVEGLLRQGLSLDLPAFQAIGYRQLAAYLRGEASLEEAVGQIEQATRRYAKRQLTWFRKEGAVSWFSIEDPQECRSRALGHLREQGIGGCNGQA